MTVPQTFRPAVATGNRDGQGSAWTGVAAGKEGKPVPRPQSPDFYLSFYQRVLLERRERKVRHCWWCGSWAYALDDCTACAAPANKADLGEAIA